MKIQLQVDPGLQQDLLTNPLNQTQALVTRGPGMGDQKVGVLGVQGNVTFAQTSQSNGLLMTGPIDPD